LIVPFALDFIFLFFPSAAAAIFIITFFKQMRLLAELNAISQFKFQFAHEVAVDAIAQIF
jgi:hypothetical protein